MAQRSDDNPASRCGRHRNTGLRPRAGAAVGLQRCVRSLHGSRHPTTRIAYMTATLELKNLECTRGERQLFTALNAVVPSRALLRVNGANGAGKTSLLRTVCGLLTPSAGEVRWRGQPAVGMREEFSRELLYLGHAPALKNDLTPVENLLVACTLGGTRPTPSSATAALARAGLGGYEATPSRHLSQGQRKRVALARLELDTAVPLWVLDEPFNALDANASAWLVSLLTTHLARGGIVVLTSHQPVDFPSDVAQLGVSL